MTILVGILILSKYYYVNVQVICYIPTSKILKYKEYLDSIGLTAETVKNSKKAYVFTDHTDTGDTLWHFQRILEYPEIGINASNVHYESLNDDLILDRNTANLYKKINIGQDTYSIKTLLGHYLDGCKLNDYANVPRVSLDNLDNIQDIVKNHTYTDEVKQMQFALIDRFIQTGSLK